MKSTAALTKETLRRGKIKRTRELILLRFPMLRARLVRNFIRARIYTVGPGVFAQRLRASEQAAMSGSEDDSYSATGNLIKSNAKMRASEEATSLLATSRAIPFA